MTTVIFLCLSKLLFELTELGDILFDVIMVLKKTNL